MSHFTGLGVNQGVERNRVLNLVDSCENRLHKRRIPVMRMLYCAVVALLLARPAFAQLVASADFTLPPGPATAAQGQENVARPNGCQKLLPGVIADGFVVPDDHKPREILLEIVKLSNDKPTVERGAVRGV